MSADPTRPLPGGWQREPGAPDYSYYRQRGRRFPLKTTIAIVVLLLLVVGADRVAASIAENTIATRAQTQMSLSGKPGVNIQGFPFLTQLAARDFKTVVITGHNLTDQQLDLANIDIVAHDAHLHGSNSVTIDSATGSVTITLASIAGVEGIGGSITLTPAGGNMINATIDVPVLGKQTAQATVTRQGANQIHVHVTDAGGIPTDLLGSLADFTVTIPKLPDGVTIQNVMVTSAGVQVDFAGSHLTLSQ